MSVCSGSIFENPSQSLQTTKEIHADGVGRACVSLRDYGGFRSDMDRGGLSSAKTSFFKWFSEASFHGSRNDGSRSTSSKQTNKPFDCGKEWEKKCLDFVANEI